jgi:hypothetical protein
MEQQVEAHPSKAVTSLGRKAWTAYVGISIIGFFLLLGLVPVVWLGSAVAQINAQHQEMVRANMLA